MAELRSPQMRARLISDEFKVRDKEKQRREKQSTASGVMLLFEETKSPMMMHNKRSSSLSRAPIDLL